MGESQGQVQKISRPLRSDPRNVQPVVSRYTDRAMPARCSLVHWYQIFPGTCCPYLQFKKSRDEGRRFLRNYVTDLPGITVSLPRRR